MGDFLTAISLHVALYPLDWTVAKVLIVAAAVGAVLGVYCRLSLGAFLVWGLIVGFLGSMFVWLIVSVLALKWAIVAVGVVAILLVAGFYLDEQSQVTGAELVEIAATRDPYLAELFARDDKAAESIASVLNLGLDESEPKWDANSVFAGVPKRVTRAIRFMLTTGFGALALLAAEFWYTEPSSGTSDGRVVTSLAFEQIEERCAELSGIEEERCLLDATKNLEQRIGSLLQSSEILVLNPFNESDRTRFDLPIEEWRENLMESEQNWVQYRNSICGTVKYLTYLGSGTGRFVAKCRLRMTFNHIQQLASYGSNYPDYK